MPPFSRHDRFWLGVARLALRRMSNRAAWVFYTVLRRAYKEEHR